MSYEDDNTSNNKKSEAYNRAELGGWDSADLLV